jgi:hypothetical protein
VIVTHRVFHAPFSHGSLNPFGDYSHLVLVATRSEGVPDTRECFLVGPRNARLRLDGASEREALYAFFLQNSRVTDTDAAGADKFLGGVK